MGPRPAVPGFAPPMTERDVADPPERLPAHDPHGRQRVSPGLVRRLSVIAEAVFSVGALGPPPERLDWLRRELDDFLSRAGGQTRLVLSLAVWAVWLLAPLSCGRFRSLASLPIRERAYALSHLEDRFGAPVLAVKALLCVHYYEHPDVAREIGFDGQCLVPLRAPGAPP